MKHISHQHMSYQQLWKKQDNFVWNFLSIIQRNTRGRNWCSPPEFWWGKKNQNSVISPPEFHFSVNSNFSRSQGLYRNFSFFLVTSLWGRKIWPTRKGQSCACQLVLWLLHMLTRSNYIENILEMWWHHCNHQRTEDPLGRESNGWRWTHVARTVKFRLYFFLFSQGRHSGPRHKKTPISRIRMSVLLCRVGMTKGTTFILVQWPCFSLA